MYLRNFASSNADCDWKSNSCRRRHPVLTLSQPTAPKFLAIHGCMYQTVIYLKIKNKTKKSQRDYLNILLPVSRPPNGDLEASNTLKLATSGHSAPESNI